MGMEPKPNAGGSDLRIERHWLQTAENRRVSGKVSRRKICSRISGGSSDQFPSHVVRFSSDISFLVLVKYGEVVKKEGLNTEY